MATWAEILLQLLAWSAFHVLIGEAVATAFVQGMLTLLPIAGAVLGSIVLFVPLVLLARRRGAPRVAAGQR